MLSQLGPYKLERMLGRGGMGAVYAGVSDETGERAAIKVLSPVLADDPGFRERFKAEIETLKKLRQPNIVQLYGYGEHDGHLFYAMELVEGRSLQEELQSGRKFDWREVCRIGIAICQGLKHAHDVGVIHRDLKPANLLIAEDGTVKLSDFGIAKLYGMSHLTGDGGVLGTADYMAPEQADGRPVTTRCDLYSLGSLLFALLARRPPFAAPTMAEVLHALKYDEAPSVRQFARNTPPELDKIIAELLDKDPQKRIATPLVLSNRLRAMLHALSEEKELAALNADTKVGDDEDAFVIRMQEDPAPLPLAQQPTQAPSESEARQNDVDLGPTPTRPMTAPIKRNSGPAAEPESPARHFTVVDNQPTAERNALPPLEDDGVPLWGMLTAAAVLALVAGGLGWYYLQPPGADGLYAKIVAASEEDDPSLLANVEPQIEQFLAHHSGDPRYSEVAAIEQELELYRLQRRLELRARRMRDGETLTPVEQAYLEAMGFERSAPETATARLEALIDVFGSDPDASRNTNRCVDLARRQLNALRVRMANSDAANESVVLARLKEADELAAADPEAAEAICRGVLTLYEDKPWAAESVDAAKKLLESIEAERVSKQE